jgi:hypothetical protein
MIVTIDVGIKHLALCIMNTSCPSDFQQYNIVLWDVFDLLNVENHTCQSLTKKNTLCNKKCNYKYEKENTTFFTCKTHFPKDIILSKNNSFKPKNFKDYLLQEIAIIVLNKLNLLFEEYHSIFSNVTKVLIELQPQINNKMKFISHILYGKFVEKLNDTATIRFVRAAQKLKAYTGPNIQCNLKNAYEQRKFYAIQYTKWFLENKFNKEQYDKWYHLLNNSPDKADTFLMAINDLHGIPKQYTKSIITNKKSLKIKRKKSG